MHKKIMKMDIDIKYWDNSYHSWIEEENIPELFQIDSKVPMRLFVLTCCYIKFYYN